MLKLKTLTQIGLLLAAWVAWFYLLTFLTQLIFTPWDGAIDWPAVGTWQRNLNDFFAGDPGRLSISIPVILINIYLTIAMLRQRPEQLNQLIRRTWLFIPVVILICFAAMMLNNAVYPYPPVEYDPHYRGFYRSVIPGIAMIGLCAFWLLRWPRMVFRLPTDLRL